MLRSREKWPKLVPESLFGGPMQKVLAGCLVALVGFAPTPVLASPSFKVEQLTLDKSSAGSLPLASRQRIDQFMVQVPQAERLNCSSYRLASYTKTQNIKLRAQASKICGYAKSKNPQLQTTVTSMLTTNKSLGGRFLLSFATQIKETISTEIINQVPKVKSLAGLQDHILKIEQLAQLQKPISLEYVAGPSTSPEKVKLVTGRFAEKLRIFQLLGLTKLNMDWVIASEKDYEWWRSYRSGQLNTYPLSVWDKEKNILGHCTLSSDIFCGAGHSIAGKTYQDNVVGTAFMGRGLDYVTRHESAHFYQGVFGYGNRCWWAEGQATFFETYLEKSRTRAQVIERLQKSPTRLVDSNFSQLEQKLSNNSVCEGDHDLTYDLGLLAMEYIYMNYSLQKVHDLQVKSSNADWSAAVREVLNIDASVLNKQMAEYIFSQWK